MASGQGLQRGFGPVIKPGQTTVAQQCRNLVPAGRVVIEPDGIGVFVPLKGFAKFRSRLQRPSGHDHLRIARLPIIQRGQNGGRGEIIGVFDKGDARTGKKPLGLDRVDQQGGFAALRPGTLKNEATRSPIGLPVAKDAGGSPPGMQLVAGW